MKDKRIRISQIQIKNFRSIRNEVIVPKELNIFVGLNDAGKSNILKALNLFFNGETDYGKKFSFAYDFTYLFPKSSHSTKEIRITIKFDIPDTYSESGEYTWTKVWRTNGYFVETILNSEGNPPTPKSRVPGALRRIKYRYVPAIKSREYFRTLLGDLYTAVFSSINNPLEASVNTFSASLRDYTQELSNSIERQLQISSLLSFPDDLNDIFRALIFETSSNYEGCVNVPLSARGDGIQIRHIPIILRFIANEDQKSRQRGSMKVCTIWGFEEPENGLELLKTFQLANEFESYSNEIQIFLSTHSPAFYMKKDTESASVYFVSKKGKSDETIISESISSNILAENMGLLPLVAPFIKEQSKRIEKAEKIYNENYLTDIPTILVEGETDIDYLSLAIENHSPSLHQLINNQQLRIVCKKDGAGTEQLSDWVLAWVYSGFKSKMYALFDKDEAGIFAKHEVDNNEVYKQRQNSICIKTQFIQPSDEIVTLLHKHINLEFEIEHLLSLEFWKKIKEHNYQEPRTIEELNKMFSGLVPRDKTLDNVIDELVDNVDLRDSILTFCPKKLKKKKIVELLKKDENIFETTSGMKRTIKKLEDYFL